MITFTYTAPADGEITVSGTWSDGSNSGDFRAPIIYVNGAMDLPATEARVKSAIQQDLSKQVT